MSPQTALGCTCTKNSPPGVQRHPKALLTAALSSVTPGYAPRTPVIVPWGPRPGAAEPATVWPRPPSHTRCVLVPGLTPGVCAHARHRAKCLPATALLRRPGEPRRGRRRQRPLAHDASLPALRPSYDLLWPLTASLGPEGGDEDVNSDRNGAPSPAPRTHWPVDGLSHLGKGRPRLPGLCSGPQDRAWTAELPAGFHGRRQTAVLRAGDPSAAHGDPSAVRGDPSAVCGDPSGLWGVLLPGPDHAGHSQPLLRPGRQAGRRGLRSGAGKLLP